MTCRCESCCPNNPSQTYTRLRMLECEAKTLLSWPLKQRREFLADVEKKRGTAATEMLKAEILRQHESKRGAA